MIRLFLRRQVPGLNFYRSHATFVPVSRH